MEKVVAGIKQFKTSSYNERKALFGQLANGQSPEVLFVTCADSRIDPCLVTHSDPGDLFVIRNAGNIVPPHSQQGGGETASIEFAIEALGVKHVVICGHSDCGAMKGAINPKALDDLPQVQRWLDYSRAAVDTVKAKHGEAGIEQLAQITEENVLLQLQHLRTHPSVASRLASGDIDLHGWVYNIGHGTIDAYDESKGQFVDAEERYAGLLAGKTQAA